MPGYHLQYAQSRKYPDDPNKIVLETLDYYFHAADYEAAESHAAEYLLERRMHCGEAWHEPIKQFLHERPLRRPMKFFPDFEHLPAYLS